MEPEGYTYEPIEQRVDRTGVSIHAGFPNPAAERTATAALSLDQLLVGRPSSTFFFELSGSSWQEPGLLAGDLAVIDRALSPRPSDLIIAWRDNQFILVRFRRLPKDVEPFGVITAIIHRYREDLA